MFEKRNLYSVADHLVDLMKEIDKAAKAEEPIESIAKRFNMDVETVKLVIESRSLFNRINDPSSS